MTADEESQAYPRYVLVLVVIGFVLNFLDRQILTLLIPALKDAFQVSDASLGFLSGFAFAAFYVTLGLPIAHLADRKSRRVILSTSITVWSGMTALCGAAQNFWQLALARFGVGAGEAGFSPAALSMLADYFPPRQHASVMSIASMGLPIGVMLGFGLGAVGLQAFGWRGAFLLAGLPGLAFAALFFLTVREPKRVQPLESDPQTLAASLGALRRIKPYWWMVAANCTTSFGIYGLFTWVPSLLTRSYGLSPAATGYVLALIMGGGGCIGLLAGGMLSDRFSGRFPAFGAWLSAGAAALGFISLAVAMSGTSVVPTVSLLGVAYTMALVFNGPIMALIYRVVPPTSRSFATGLLLFCVNLIGLGTGPFTVGLVSDLLAPQYATESLRIAMLFWSSIYILAVMLYIGAARSLSREFSRLSVAT